MKHPSLLEIAAPIDPKADLPPVSILKLTKAQEATISRLVNTKLWEKSTANYLHDEITKNGHVYIYGKGKKLGKYIKIKIDGTIEDIY